MGRGVVRLQQRGASRDTGRCHQGTDGYAFDAGPGRFDDRGGYEGTCHRQVVGRLVSLFFVAERLPAVDLTFVCRWSGQSEGQGREGLFPASYVKLL